MAVAIDPKAAKATADVVDQKLVGLIRTGLVANIFLFFAGCMNVGFYARQLVVDWLTQDVISDVLYMLGFSTFFLVSLLWCLPHCKIVRPIFTFYVIIWFQQSPVFWNSGSIWGGFATSTTGGILPKSAPIS